MGSTLEVMKVEPEEPINPSGLECLVIVARQHGLHLTASQLTHDNLLTGGEVSTAELIKCATTAGLSAKSITLDWKGLARTQESLAFDRQAEERRQHGAASPRRR